MKYRKFFIKFVTYMFILLALAGSLVYGSMKEPYRNRIIKITSSEDYTDIDVLTALIERADGYNENTMLIIGDSIANQLFGPLDNENDYADVLTSNAAFMITGQFVVFNHYIENHPECKDVYLIMHPLSLSRNFDYEWSYQYSATILAKNHCFDELEPSTVKTMHKMYGFISLTRPFIYLIQESPVCRKLWLNYMNMNREVVPLNSSFELADIYVKKMYDMCISKGIVLHLMSTPVSMNHKEMVEGISDDFAGSWIGSVYTEYINNIYYYDDIMSEDHSHFSGVYADREHLNEMIGYVYSDENFLLEMR